MNEMQAATMFGFAGEVVAGVRLAGVCVTAVVQPDLVEVQRRDATGLGAVLEHDLTEALAQLPTDWPVARSDLDPVTLRLLDGAPPGVVESNATAVTRLWRPALTVTGVLTTSRDWRAGLRSVSLFAGDAPRGLVLTQQPHRLEPILERAQGLGIGVLAPDSPEHWRLLLEPHRELSSAPGPSHWRFLETTYLAWRRLLTQRSAVQLLK
jgi:hypothetical protein